VLGISGSEGDFTVSVRQKPRYVDMDKCIACGTCAAKCPKKVPDEYNQGMAVRKAIYVPYSQAVPLKYVIDPDQCIYLNKGKCGACEKLCPTQAINFNDKEKTFSLRVGSVILAPGFKSFDPARYEGLGYGELPDVITSLEFERNLSATGPTHGHVVCPSDKKKETSPRKIAWIQCVGSRDINQGDHAYCSTVCCMYAIKQAVIAMEHATDSLECTIFFMDMRTPGKDFDRYLEKAAQLGIRFIRCRPHSVEGSQDSHGARLAYVQQNGVPMEEDFDLVVLSTGLEADPKSIELAHTLGIELDDDNFVNSSTFNPVATSRPGIYACGAFTGPKDIPQSVMESSAAACAATDKLAALRHSQISHTELPPETVIGRQEPRIGVFLCHCGINIAGVIDMPHLAEYAQGLDKVVHVEENLFTCSQDTQERLAEIIRERELNRVVVAACSPRTHESLFQESLRKAGLNKYLFEMANIRNLDSWVHSDDPEAATQKAMDMVRMAVAKAALLCPLSESELPVNRSTLVVGGGVAGMTAALSLARQGFPTHLVEKGECLGGNTLHLNQTSRRESVGPLLDNLIAQVESEDKIIIHTETEIQSVDGFVGNFRTNLRSNDSCIEVEHGAAILATGATEYKPDEYLYGKHPVVLTNLELDEELKSQAARLDKAENVVFIQCVGSRETGREYCSKVCCTHSILNALALKKQNPDCQVFVLYRDIRTYGQRERLYHEARKNGIVFIRYTPESKPVVTADGGRLQVEVTEPLLQRQVKISCSLLCLATAVVSHNDKALAQHFRVPLDADGWLLEAHQKLRPVDFAAEGIFLCGMAHFPKPLEESISQAKAAASRALGILTKDSITVGGVVSRIDPELCSGCLGCLNVCPYGAIDFNPTLGAAEVNPALCKGCGACAAACPSEAPVLLGFNNQQLYAQIMCAVSA
jgi:heterodisulfide reductase subunit A